MIIVLKKQEEIKDCKAHFKRENGKIGTWEEFSEGGGKENVRWKRKRYDRYGIFKV